MICIQQATCVGECGFEATVCLDLFVAPKFTMVQSEVWVLLGQGSTWPCSESCSSLSSGIPRCLERQQVSPLHGDHKLNGGQPINTLQV